jgi:hypothetical protein
VSPRRGFGFAMDIKPAYSDSAYLAFTVGRELVLASAISQADQSDTAG